MRTHRDIYEHIHTYTTHSHAHTYNFDSGCHLNHTFFRAKFPCLFVCLSLVLNEFKVSKIYLKGKRSGDEVSTRQEQAMDITFERVQSLTDDDLSILPKQQVLSCIQISFC